MSEKPFEKANQLIKAGTRTSGGAAVVFIALTIVSGVLHNKALMIVFLVLAVLSAATGFFLTLAGVRRNNADVRDIVAKAKAEQRRRYNG